MYYSKSVNETSARDHLCGTRKSTMYTKQHLIKTNL